MLRSLSENAAEVPCWSWGNNTLAESFLGVISVHTLVWQTRMTGYVLFSLDSWCLDFQRVPVVGSAPQLTRHAV